MKLERALIFLLLSMAWAPRALPSKRKRRHPSARATQRQKRKRAANSTLNSGHLPFSSERTHSSPPRSIERYIDNATSSKRPGWPCLRLSEPRCPRAAEPRCDEATTLEANFFHPEKQAGEKLVPDRYPCYPLTDDDFWRSRDAVRGNTTRLLEVLRRAREGHAITVVSVGGSVTHGALCETSALHSNAVCAWTNRFVLWLRRHTANARITHVPLARPGTTSMYALTNFNRIRKAEPDLLLVDYGVNDPIVSVQEGSSGRAQYSGMIRAATEAIIRNFLAYSDKRGAVGSVVYLATQRNWIDESYCKDSSLAFRS